MLETKYKSIFRLPRRQREQLADSLRTSVAREESSLTAEQKSLLDERMEAYQSGKMKSVPWEIIEKKLKK